jgi:hypothetical protein
MWSGGVECSQIPAYLLCARLADVKLSTNRTDRGNPVLRELLGEHLCGLFLQRVGIVLASGHAASRHLRTPG